MSDAAEADTPSGGAPAAVASLEVRRIKAAARAKLFGDTRGGPLRISRYMVLRQLGVGGMGEVFLALDAELGRKVAIKLVRLDRDRGVERASSRLLREAQALARLSHPHVVQVYEVGSFEGRVFIAMEFVDGVHMRRWLELAPRTWREVLDLYIQAGQGLAAAHQHGMVHRDFKPENVLVGQDDGRVRVVDFGLVRSAPDADSVEPLENASADDLERSSRLTQSGVLMGTPSYMSPEQLQGLKATPKSDQFAFCVALYRGLYGWHPFAAESRAELKRRVLSGRVSPPPRDARVPRRLLEVMLRGLQVDPDARWPSMEALLAALAQPPSRRWHGLLAGTALAAVFAGAWLSWDAAGVDCSHEDELASVWSPGHAEAVKAAFTGTGLAYASLAADRARGALDRYADALRRGRALACEPAGDDAAWAALQERRGACLDRRQRRLAVVAGALARADAAVVERADAIVESLPSIAPCLDDEALEGSLRPPADPGVRAGVREARGWLDQARELSLRGRPGEALPRAEQAQEAANRLHDSPLLAEAKAEIGRLQVELGAREPGVGLLLEAVDLAESHRHDELAAEVWLTLAELAEGPLDDVERGNHWSRRAAAAVARVHDRERGRISALLVRGRLQLRQRRFAEAEIAFREAIDVIGTADAPIAFTSASAQLALGRALAEQGRTREARGPIERALGQVRGLTPEGHPKLAEALEALGHLCRREGLSARAREHLAEALAIRRTLPGQARPLARLHLDLAELAAGADDRAQAREHYAAALALSASSPGLLSPQEIAAAESGRAAAGRPPP